MPTTFIPTLDALPARKSPLMERFAALLEPKAPAQIEAMSPAERIGHVAEIPTPGSRAFFTLVFEPLVD